MSAKGTKASVFFLFILSPNILLLAVILPQQNYVKVNCFSSGATSAIAS
jgi:hypothetical protein